MRKMKIVFFGTSQFAIPSLRALVDSPYEIVAVVTQPDRAKGRHLKVASSPIKLLATKCNLPILQPEKISDPKTIEFLRGLKPELFAVVSYGQILPKAILEIPKLYSVNLHGSLLPKYRGAAPINWAIAHGETVTGVTIFRMTEEMDEGDILLKGEVQINEADTALTLGERLSKIGASLLIEAIEVIESGREVFRPQHEKEASYAPRLKKSDGEIDWGKPSIQIRNWARAMVPWPDAFTYHRGKRLKLLEIKVLERKKGGMADAGGRILEINKEEGIVVRTKDGAVGIERLQLEGGKPMPASQFVLGHLLKVGEVFGETER